MQPKVKRLTPADTDALRMVTAISAICIPEEAWSYASFLAETKKPGGYVLAAIGEDGLPVGFLTASLVLDEAELTSIAVYKQHRRQGIADLLLRELSAQLGEDVRIFLEVRVSNAAAISLYEKHGFQRVGIRRRFYHNPEEDAFILKK